jgi:hypothetical protein
MAVEKRETFTCDVCGLVVELEDRSSSVAPRHWFKVWYRGDSGPREYGDMVGGDLCSSACLARWSDTAPERLRADQAKWA